MLHCGGSGRRRHSEEDGDGIAGDAFGSGFLYGYVKGWDLHKAARLGNACGAMVVTRHGCSISMPFWEEVMAFVDERGGL